MCDRVIVMYAGKVIESGTVDDIFYNPQHPYTKGLLRSVPRLDLNREEPLTPIYGTPPDLLRPPKGCAFVARCESAMRVCQEFDPEMSDVSRTQKSACWLQHPFAQNRSGSYKGGVNIGKERRID
jgi:oligopeptide transport system ATP-binding protein